MHMANEKVKDIKQQHQVADCDTIIHN